MRTELPRQGPSWGDIRQYLVEIATTHNVAVYVRMMPAWDIGPTEWVAIVGAHMPLQRDKPTRGPTEVHRGFPHRDHQTIEGMVYRLCYELDYKLGNSAYTQADMF